MDNYTDQHAKALLEAFQNQRGYAVNEPGCTLMFLPGPLIEGIQTPGSLVVIELGRGSVLLDDPNHFNKFIFAKSGFSLSVGQRATAIIKRLLVLMADVKAQSNEVSVPQIEPPLSGQQGD